MSRGAILVSMSAPRFSREDLRAYLDRGWSEAREATERYVAEDAQRRGAAGGAAISDALWADMHAIDPSWPDDEQRRCDLAHHLAVCDKLARLHHVQLAR
jgi:hypothetical protein